MTRINYFSFLLKQSGFGVQQTLAYQQFFRQIPTNSREKFGNCLPILECIVWYLEDASGLTPNEIKFLRDNVNKEEEFIKSFSQATTLRQKQELEAQWEEIKEKLLDTWLDFLDRCRQSEHWANSTCQYLFNWLRKEKKPDKYFASKKICY